VSISEAWCDRAPPAAERPLTFELLVDLARALAGIEGRGGR
jgi:hypothetical protein